MGGFYSNCLHAWDFDRDGKADILTASHFIGALTLLWKNHGNGRSSRCAFPTSKSTALPLRDVPGTFGRSAPPRSRTLTR